MKKIFLEEKEKVRKNKLKLERSLKVKLAIKENEVEIEGDAEKEFVAEKIIEALNFDFPIEFAMLIKEGYLFEILNIKEYTGRKDLERVRARIIGKQGRALRTLTNLTDCHFELKGNEVGIIGHPEDIKNAQDAMISIIQGSKHGKVYSFLEKNKSREEIDLGLKQPKKDKE